MQEKQTSRLKRSILYSASIAALVCSSASALAQTVASTDEELEVVVITGIRQSLESAQSIKRNANQILDAIVAEDIGKLPDVTASESLARVTGIQVSRAQGEAGQVLVRGLPDVTTTYNGREIFTAEARFVALQDFPAGGIAALEVFKSSTADLIDAGIAGLINVRSRRPFDFDDTEIAGSVRGTYANQSGKADFNGNILLSDRWETGIGEVGALINASYTELHYLDSARFNGGFIATARPEQTSQPGFRFPDGVGIFMGTGHRWRPSVNGSVQWRPTSELEFYVDGLYQGFRNRVADRLLFVPLFGDPDFTNVVLQPGTNQAQSLTATGAVEPNMFQGATNGETDTYQFAVGGIYETGSLKISADIARTDSKFDLSIFSLDSAFNRSPVVDVNFDVPSGTGGVDFSFQDFDTNDPANFLFRGFFDRHLIAKGDDVQFRTDLQYQTGFDFIPEIAFGLRFVDRDGGFENGERFAFTQPQGILLSALPVELEIFRPGFQGSSIQQTRTWVTATRDSIRENVAELREISNFAAGRPPADPLQSFTANEKSYTAYGQITYAFDAGLPVDGVIGLRAVKTETTLIGTSRIITGSGEELVPNIGEGDATSFLPNISARVRFSDELQLRLAATQTRTRPNFNQLNPALFVDPPSTTPFRTGRGGNPDLKPVKSNNFDASLEYYFSPTGSVSVAIFRRDVNGFVANFTRSIQDPDLGEIRVNRPENGGAGKLQGVETQLTTFLDFESFPDWMRNFGIQANFTYIDAAQAFASELGGDVPEKLTIPNVSEYSYNLVGLYETETISARVAYNYRSKFANFFDNTQDGQRFAGEFTEGVARLDFSAGYTPFENITFTFDVSNILGRPFKNFRNFTVDQSFPRDVRFEDRVLALGVRFRI